MCIPLGLGAFSVWVDADWILANRQILALIRYGKNTTVRMLRVLCFHQRDGGNCRPHSACFHDHTERLDEVRLNVPHREALWWALSHFVFGTIGRRKGMNGI